MQLKTKWLVFSIAGLLLTGAGLSIFGEALSLRLAGAVWTAWFWWGTASLVVFNSGLSLIGQAVVYRTQLSAQNNQTSNPAEAPERSDR